MPAHAPWRPDPWLLQSRGQPEPVDGPLLPAVLVQPEEEPLARPHPPWRRAAAAGMALGFLAATVASAFATTGAFSPLTDAGDWRHLRRTLQP